MNEEAKSQQFGKWSLSFCIIFLVFGIFLRLWPTAGFHSIGFDEHQYSKYVEMAAKRGLWNYGAVIDSYIVEQVHQSEAIVPATRIGFLWPATLLAEAGLTPYKALRTTSLMASIALLVATAAMAYRFSSPALTVGVTALLAVAPLQIYLAQRALVDGYFAFLAVLCAWFFLEALRASKTTGWVVAYGATLFLLVLTKENAAFVFAALLATAAVLFWARISRPGLSLLVVSFLAPAFALCVLAVFMGGIPELIIFYRMFVQKSTVIPYSLRFQDGAWYRYLVDFIVLSPAIVILVLGRVFQLGKKSANDLFWALFLGFSFVLMSSLRYGMSLRFAAYWDPALRWLAMSQLLVVANRIPPRIRAVALFAALLALGGIDLSQYHRLFVKGRIYDPVSAELLRASDLIK
jgi:hypothetical protein